MRINPPADDYGLQRLKQEDSKRQVKAPEKVAPTPAIGPGETEARQLQPEKPLISRRHRKKRQRLTYDSLHAPHAPAPSYQPADEGEAPTDPADQEAPSLGRDIDDFA